MHMSSGRCRSKRCTLDRNSFIRSWRWDSNCQPGWSSEISPFVVTGNVNILLSIVCHPAYYSEINDTTLFWQQWVLNASAKSSLIRIKGQCTEDLCEVADQSLALKTAAIKLIKVHVCWTHYSVGRRKSVWLSLMFSIFSEHRNSQLSIPKWNVALLYTGWKTLPPLTTLCMYFHI